MISQVWPWFLLNSSLGFSARDFRDSNQSRPYSAGVIILKRIEPLPSSTSSPSKIRLRLYLLRVLREIIFFCELRVVIRYYKPIL